VSPFRVERRKSLDKAEPNVRYLKAVFGGMEVRQIITSECIEGKLKERFIFASDPEVTLTKSDQKLPTYPYSSDSQI
jgi:hypothetical protein